MEFFAPKMFGNLHKMRRFPMRTIPKNPLMRLLFLCPAGRKNAILKKGNRFPFEVRLEKSIRLVQLQGGLFMFHPGEFIVYGNTGVCRVVSLGHPPQIPTADTKKLYYTLAPLYSNEVIYTPVDTPVFMRHVLTHEAADALIDKIPLIREEIDSGREKRISECYRTLFESHRCEDLLQLIKTLYTKGQQSMEKGKHLGSIDQRYMKRAEDLLHGELSVALGIPKEEVVDYIARRTSH